MRRDEAGRFQAAGKDVACTTCGCDRFWIKFVKMNTTGMEFLGLGWANKDAASLICRDCSHVAWFYDESRLERIETAD